MCTKCAGLPPVTLCAAKATLGHTETAAGAIGIFRATTRLQHAAHPELLHLRSLNPYVTSSLDAARSDAAKALAGRYLLDKGTAFVQHSSFAAARQPAAAPSDTVGSGGCDKVPMQGASGISAFAFQGTNAHVLVAASASCKETLVFRDSAAASSAAAPWQRRRFWYSPAPSRLLAGVAVEVGGSTAVFTLQLQAPSLAYLRDHQVCTRP